MQVGDLVKLTGLNDVSWYLGIVTMIKRGRWTKVFVEWATGEHGWHYCSDLEAACK